MRTPEVKVRLLANTEAAVARGFGMPTSFVGKEMFFGKDRLRDRGGGEVATVDAN